MTQLQIMLRVNLTIIIVIKTPINHPTFLYVKIIIAESYIWGKNLNNSKISIKSIQSNRQIHP